MKTVGVIGTVGVPANYGGFETMVENLLEHRQDPEVQYLVYCSSKAYRQKLPSYKGAVLKYFPLKANGWQAIPYDALCYAHAWFHCDVLLILGGDASWILPLLRLFGRRRMLFNYDGFETQREKLGFFSRNYIRFNHWLASRWSDVHIADNEAITTLLEEHYGISSTLIEYGGDSAFVVADDGSLEREYGLRSGEYDFNVARIEPENNTHVLLEAYSRMSDRQLVLVGNWNKSEYGKTLRERYAAYGNILMLDPIYEGTAINRLRSNCRLYLHPHSVGGTNPSLVEAMWLGLPIVTFDVVYNRVTTEGKARYFSDAASLLTVVRELDGAALSSLGEQMHEIAQRRYRWDVIAAKYEALY